MKTNLTLSKIVSLGILSIMTLAGLAACFKGSFIEIGSYTEFAKAFVGYFIPYLTIVGVGRGVKGVATMKYSSKDGVEVTREEKKTEK